MESTLTMQSPPVASQPFADGEREDWTAVFVLSAELNLEDRRRVLAGLDLPTAIVRQENETAVSVGVSGPMDQALANAVAAINRSLEEASPSATVVEVRMVGHRDAARQLATSAPVTYYGVTECAKALGISSQRVRQLIAEDKLPEPDALLGGTKPMWRAETFDTFAKRRTESVRNTPLGLRPTNDPLEE